MSESGFEQGMRFMLAELDDLRRRAHADASLHKLLTLTLARYLAENSLDSLEVGKAPIDDALEISLREAAETGTLALSVSGSDIVVALGMSKLGFKPKEGRT